MLNTLQILLQILLLKLIEWELNNLAFTVPGSDQWIALESEPCLF